MMAWSNHDTEIGELNFMENNNNKGGDGKMPGQGQGQTMLIILIAALITFVSIFKMGDYLREIGRAHV